MFLREYEYILAIARERNMHRAADSLYVSQPVLSRLLRDVEIEVGAPLFERRGRAMIPTDIGRTYIANAQQIVALNTALMSSMKPEKTDPPIQLLMPMVWLSAFTSGIIPAFRKVLHGIPVKVEMLSQKDLLTEMPRRRHGFGVGILSDELTERFQTHCIGQVEMVLAVPGNHPLIRKAQTREDCTYPFLPISSLEGQPVIMPRSTSYSGEFANQLFSKANITPNVVMEIPLVASVIYAVASGIGVAVLPSVPLHHLHMEEQIRYLSLRPREYAKDFGLICDKDHELKESEAVFINIARESF